MPAHHPSPAEAYKTHRASSHHQRGGISVSTIIRQMARDKVYLILALRVRVIGIHILNIVRKRLVRACSFIHLPAPTIIRVLSSFVCIDIAKQLAESGSKSMQSVNLRQPHTLHCHSQPSLCPAASTTFSVLGFAELVIHSLVFRQRNVSGQAQKSLWTPNDRGCLTSSS